MRTHHAAALAVAALAACVAGPRSAPPPAAAPPLADTELGLSKGSVFAVPTPPAWKEEGSSPGEKPLVPRLGPEIPPVIPHGVAEMPPITREQNLCVDCHQVPGPRKAGEPTPLPASHHVDYRNAPDKVGAKVAGARWLCTACHVARTDAPPLVGNAYRP